MFNGFLWLLIIALLVLSIPVGIIILFLRTAEMNKRIAYIERRIADASMREQYGDTRTPLRGDTQRVPSVQEIVPEKPANAAASSASLAVAAPPPNDALSLNKSGPWSVAPRKDQPASPAPEDPSPLGLPPDRFSGMADWLRVNWIYVVTAASLGLAGIFFVQYGMERGLLPPGLRVLAAILFGLALIGAGEWIRRRFGDEGLTSTIHLPSVFSGAGLVSIFAGVLAARQLYGLISPEVAFAAHLVTAALAVGLGWFYGPLLAGVGLIGAALSPFIVGGGSEAAPWLYAYFALIAAVGLGIDAVRRWGWVSALALVLGYGMSALSFGAGAGEAGWVTVLLLLPIMAVILPRLALIPRHPGPYFVQWVLARTADHPPTMPVRLAFGAGLATSVFLVTLSWTGLDFPMLVPAALAVLALAYLLWAHQAEGLSDLGLMPAIGFLAVLVFEALHRGDLFLLIEAHLAAGRSPEDSPLLQIMLLVGMAVAISAAASMRALQPREDRALDLGFGLMAVLVAPIAVAILEFLWAPARMIGAYSWALHIIGVAALTTALAVRFAKADRGDMQRTAHAILAALSLIALALFVLTTATALTLALAVLIIVAAALDRRFGLPEMGLFIQIAVAVISWRLLVDPGVSWALDGPIVGVALAFGGVIAAFIAARRLIPGHERSLTRAVLESAAAGLSAIFANVLLTRWLIPEVQMGLSVSHWQATLSALPWLVLMLAQLYLAEVEEPPSKVRYGLSRVAGALAGLLLIAAVVPRNPLFASGQPDAADLVVGPLLLDSLFLAYAVPALILLAACWRMPRLAAPIRLGFLGIGAALLTLYAGLEIRRLWQGNWLGVPGVKQGELYTYTLAMMTLGAGLLYQAIRHRSDLTRRIAMTVIGLTVAKVFFLDAAGLTGLTRVFSFLGLGLSLAGLAWLNRWAGKAAEGEATPSKSG